MKVEYRIASPGGDIDADSQILDRPFLLGPNEAHPFLRLRDYFDAVRGSIISLVTDSATQIPAERLIIRSEKHGALYHVASAEIFFGEESRRFAVSTAFSDRGRAFLNNEEILLRQVEKDSDLTYLPKPCQKKEVLVCGRVAISMLIAEWFEDYHEWHLGADQSHTICIWDQKRGKRFASEKEVSGIYKGSSQILTHYYDLPTFRQIRAWHHAAGDFIVNTRDETVRVRLTTVRRYEPLSLFSHAEEINPVVAVVYFFLDLSTRMRLDRIEGTGDVIWADDFCLVPVAQGFFEGIRTLADQGRYPMGEPKELLRLLKTFSREEMLSLFQPLVKLYEEENEVDFPVIVKNLGNHADALWRIIRMFP